MEYVLNGFEQHQNVRLFAFSGIGTDHSRTPFTVAADISLLHKYAIPLQELPLMCRHLLEEQQASTVEHNLTYSEAEMIAYANRRAEARHDAQQKSRHPVQDDGG